MTRRSKIRRIHTGTHPVARAMARSALAGAVRKDMADILNAAQLHAWAGSNPPRLVNDAGRLVYVVLGAATAAGMTTESPEIRIVLGMGEALGDLVADGDIERHRPAIQSGLLALERLLPSMNPGAMFDAAVELDHKLATTAGMGTADLHRMFNTTPQAAP